MRIILGSILAIVLVVVAAIVAIPLLVSTEWIRSQVVAAVNDRTGRNLQIAGETSLSVFPDLSLSVGQVAFSNADDPGAALVTMEGLDVGLKLLPLLGGGVEIDRLVLTRPVFNLEVDEAGRENWRRVEPARQPDGRTAAPTPSASPPPVAGGPVAGFDSLALGDVRLVGGEVSYVDRRKGTHHRVADINARVELPSLADPLLLSGTLLWLGETVTFETEISEPQALSTGTPTAVRLSVKTPQLQGSLRGRMAVKDGFGIEGDIELSTGSVKKVARWIGARPPEVSGLGAFSVTAGIKADETGFALDAARLSLDDITAEGSVLVGFSGPRPLVRATLAASRIDLNAYGGGAVGVPRSGSAEQSGAAPGRASSSPQTGWSDEPIDVSGLRAIDADLRISAAGLRFRDLEAGASALAVTLKDALLSVDLSELQLYDGRAAGKLTVNAAGETPAVATAFNIDNVAAHPLLAAASGIDWLEGRARITGSLASRGTTQRALVSALNGETAFVFTDGAIKGVNVAQMLRNLQVGNIAGWTEGDAQKTDFSEFSARFAFTRGIAQTNDVRLLGPLVRLSGAGVADLPNRTLDFRLSPKIVASLQGQGGGEGLSGLELPVLVRGTWAKPQVALDVEALAKDPGRTIDAVGGMVKDLTGKDIGSSLNDVVRNPQGLIDQLTGGGQGGNQPSPIGEDVFKRLLGQ